jgi:phytol kinase
LILHPLAGIGLVLFALTLLIGATWAISRVRHIDPEVARKTVHIGMGLLVLTFPWLFSEAWPVIALAALAICALLALRLGRLKTEGPGNVLLGVERSSLGDIYFPVSVACLFVLSEGDPLLYCIPILVLTLADALAALIGSRWGRMKYTTSGSHKSYEGSAAFFAVSFASVYIPLTTFGDIAWYPATLVAITVGLIVAALEAISLSGRDNLYIPFAVFVLLKLYVPLSPELLWLRLLILVAVLIFVVIARHRTTLDDAALMGSALTAYAAWVIGGWPWLVPPALVLLSYTRLYPNCYPAGRGAHNIHSVVSVTAGGYIALLLFSDTGRPGWYLPYVIAYGSQLAMIGVASLASTFPSRNLTLMVIRAAIISIVVMSVLCYVVAWSLGREVPTVVYGSILVLCSSAAFVFAAWQPRIRDCPVDAARWVRQGLIGIALSLPAIILVETER